MTLLFNQIKKENSTFKSLSLLISTEKEVQQHFFFSPGIFLTG